MKFSKFLFLNRRGLSTITALGILGICSMISSLILYQFVILDKDSKKLRLLAEKRVLIQKVLLATEDPLSYDCSVASVSTPCNFDPIFLLNKILAPTNALISGGGFEITPKEGGSFLVDDVVEKRGKWFKAVIVFKTEAGVEQLKSNIEVRVPEEYLQVSSVVESGVVKGAICPITKPFFKEFDSTTGAMICGGNQNFSDCVNGFVSEIDGSTLTQTCTAFSHSVLSASFNSYIKDGSIRRDGAGFKMEAVSRSGDPWEESW